jgi:hypothetical protein
MLFAPPPGYNTPATNRQNVQAYNLPGQQGLTPQGYNASAAPPAIPGMAPGGGFNPAAMRGSVQAPGMQAPPVMPQNGGGMPGIGQFNPSQMQMASALAGTAPRAAA